MRTLIAAAALLHVLAFAGAAADRDLFERRLNGIAPVLGERPARSLCICRDGSGSDGMVGSLSTKPESAGPKVQYRLACAVAAFAKTGAARPGHVCPTFVVLGSR